MTDFEKHLSRATVRQIPPHWREEILATAEATRPARRIFLPNVLAFLAAIRACLWPHPAVWAVMAACWMVVAGLCFSGPRGPALYAVTPPGGKPLGITPERYAAYLRVRDHFMTTENRAEPPTLNRRDL